MGTQGFFTWSTTAASNGGADASINMSEGMAPSAVNDGVRALMARLREYGNDISGSIVTAGTGTAYTVASNEGFDSLAHLSGQAVAFTPHTTNGATVTLAVDGLGAKPLRYGPNLELQSGMLIAGTPYVAVFSNSDGAFYLRGFNMNPYGVPLGGLLPYTGTTAPNSAFALPSGQAISRTGFASYFALVGTTYGPGDGSTTFNILDLRGRSIFGLDNMGGSAANRITVAGGNFNGTTLGATGGAENHTLTQGEMPSHTHTANVTDPGHVHSVSGGDDVPGSPGNITLTSQNTVGNSRNTASATTGITVSNTNTGAGGAHTILNPCMVLPFILRVI